MKNNIHLKKAESLLRDSEKKYREIFENINDAIFMADVKTRRLVDCNKLAEKLIGRSKKEILSFKADRLHPSHIIDKSMSSFNKMVRGVCEFTESEVIRKDGTIIPVEIKSTVINMGGKNVLMGVFRNISDRIAMLDNLRSSEDKFQKMFEYSKVGAVVASAEGRIVHSNRVFCGMIGYSEKELLNMKVLDITHPEDRKASSDIIMKLRDKMIQNAEATKRYLRKDGSVLYAETSVSVFYDYYDRTSYVIAQIFDVTEMIADKNKLRNSEERYRALAEMAEDPIYVLDRRGTISYVNTYGAAYFNKKPADLIGKRLPSLFGRKVGKRLIGNIARVYDTGKSVFAFGEFDFHGSKFWLDTRLSPITDKKGNILNVMGVSRDVTSHRRAEEVLERDKKELERLVEENSRKLLDAQKKLDRCDRLAEMGTLSASVAHELRSPLAAIGIAAYNIKTKSNDPQLDKNIRNIEIKVMESDQIIKNLLIFSGIKSPMRESVKIYDLINDSIDLVHSIFPEYNVKIRKFFKCSPDIALQADPVQLKEVFNNILNNSFESFACKKGEIDISVSECEGDDIKIVFKDNGPGIAREALKSAFQPFNTTKAGGTGLGLPVCKQIIDLHKGTIGISSKPGYGTTVVIHLPLKFIHPANKRSQIKPA